VSRTEAGKHILVINDAQEVLEVVKALLEDEGYRVTIHSKAIRDLENITAIAPDLIILDHLMGAEEYGWQMVQLIRLSRELATLPLIVCTAAKGMVEQIQGHLKAKGVTVVLKPFDVDDLLRAVAAAFATQSSA
jgi:two-component system, OmpR family, response regulator MprA